MRETRATGLVQAGVTTAAADGAFAVVVSLILYGNVGRIFQGVASTLMGRAALTGGTRTALIGVVMHVGVAFGWSAVFIWGLARLSAVRRALTSTARRAALAAVYGPFVWIVMSCVVIPALTHRPPVFAGMWWIELLGHIPCVGVPIVFSCRLRAAAARL